MDASIALFLLLAQVPPAAPARMATPNEAQAIVAGLLTYETTAYPQPPSERTCVNPILAVPLQLEREDRIDRRRELHPETPLSENEHDWAQPEPRPDPSSPQLDEARARQLDHLVAAALVALSPRTAHARRIAPAAVPPALLLGPRPHCRYGIALTAPFLVGEVAFIEGNYETGGNLYALERRGERWTVFALAWMWLATPPPPPPPPPPPAPVPERSPPESAHE